MKTTIKLRYVTTLNTYDAPIPVVVAKVKRSASCNEYVCLTFEQRSALWHWETQFLANERTDERGTDYFVRRHRMEDLPATIYAAALDVERGTLMEGVRLSRDWTNAEAQWVRVALFAPLLLHNLEDHPNASYNGVVRTALRVLAFASGVLDPFAGAV